MIVRTKKLFILFLLACMCLLFGACEAENLIQPVKSSQTETDMTTSKEDNEKILKPIDESENKEVTAMQINISANGNTIVYELNDSKAARELYE